MRKHTSFNIQINPISKNNFDSYKCASKAPNEGKTGKCKVKTVSNNGAKETKHEDLNSSNRKSELICSDTTLPEYINRSSCRKVGFS